MNDFKPCLAEFLGTFYLCFAGIATILSVAPPLNSGAGLVGIALAHGLALSIAVCVFGGISGAHINPAVTVAMLVTGRIRFTLAIGYVIAQLLGATAAAAVCGMIFSPYAVIATSLGTPILRIRCRLGSLLRQCCWLSSSVHFCWSPQSLAPPWINGEKQSRSGDLQSV